MLLGDRIEKFLTDIKIGPAFKKYMEAKQRDCGCEDRKIALNDLHAGIIVNTKEGLNAIADLYSSITGHKIGIKERKSQCPSCWKARMATISKYLKEESIKIGMQEQLKGTPFDEDTYNPDKDLEKKPFPHNLPSKPLEEMNMKELRAAYPSIKANSKEKFIRLLNED